MKRVQSMVLLTILLVSTNLNAGIRRVGLNQTYTTLTAAYTAAVNDDTLLISPGVYSETITSTKRLHWIGAGYDEVTVNGRLILNSGSSGTRVEGIQIKTSIDDGVLKIAGGVDLITIKRVMVEEQISGGYSGGGCILRTASPGGYLLLSECLFVLHGVYFGGHALNFNGDGAVIRNCLFAGLSGNGSCYVFSGNPQSLDVSNCAFVGFNSVNNCSNNGFPFELENSIAHDWGSGGTWGGNIQSASYNASSTIAPPGTDGILLAGDPFVNYDETANYIYGSSDLHLAGGSPCVDTGDPAVLDLDNSRSDMGIYGGPTPHVDGGAPNYPFAIDLTIPANMSAGQQLPIQATGRIGAGY